MINALILHGTGATSKSNWFPWLKSELEGIGWKVWTPNLPGADAPDPKEYNDLLLNSDWKFNSDSIIIGHSSGSVEILHLLQNLPKASKVKAAILVGSFEDDLGRDDLKKLFEESFDFEKIKKQAEKFIFIHSEDDPNCPLKGAKHLAEQVEGEMVVFKDKQHFSAALDPSFTKFPEIIPIIEDATK